MILVTGGAGFVGSHVVERLLADGERVRVLDSCAPQPGEDGERSRAAIERWGGRQDLEVLEADLRDPVAVRAALRDVSGVIHLAAVTGARRSLTDPVPVIDSRCRGTAVLLAAMEEHGVGRLVLGSTAHALGEGGPHPVDRSGRPVSPYGAAAAGAEAQVSAWVATSRGRAAVVRLTSVYGPRMRPDQAVYRFLLAAAEERPVPILGSGDAVRDWLYVEDAVEVLLAALDAPDRHLVCHAGSGRGISVLTLVERIREATEASVSVEMFDAQSGEPHTLLLDILETRNRLGWNAQVDLRSGLLRTWAWVLAHGS